MSFYKVTLQRSVIGLPEKVTINVKKLGLHKRNSVVFHKIDPRRAGQIAAIKELVDVEVVDKALTPQELRDSRKSNPGFVIESKN